MSNPQEPINLTLTIETPPGVDTDRLDRWTRQLRAELRELDVGAVTLATDSAVPAGAKAVDAVLVGNLAMTVLPLLLPKLLEYMQHWSTRTPERAIKIKTQRGDQSVEVEFSGGPMSQDELKSLVQSLRGTMS